MKSVAVLITLALAVARTPAPRITIGNPKLLYAAAMYETAVGDIHSALRFLHWAEQAEQVSGSQSSIRSAAGITPFVSPRAVPKA